MIPVYFRCNNGGWNKSHGQIEKTPRLDSFEAGAVEGRGTLFTYQDGKVIFIECDHNTDYRPETEREIVELYAGNRSGELELTRIANGFGGSRAFWLCPVCGGRFRYLYLTGAAFLCRKCARLNYRSQQQTRGSMTDYFKGMNYVEKHLSPPSFPIDGFSFVKYLPEKPKGMHKTTYRRHLIHFFRYQSRYIDRLILDFSRICR